MVDFTLSPEIRELRKKVKTFMEEHIYPNEPVFHEGGAEADGLMKELQAKVKAMDMWAMFIGPEAGGTGTGFLPYAYVNEILGRSDRLLPCRGQPRLDDGNAGFAQELLGLDLREDRPALLSRPLDDARAGHGSRPVDLRLGASILRDAVAAVN